MRLAAILTALLLGACASSAAPTPEIAPAVSSQPAMPVAAEGPCGFDARALSFQGDASTQARCLLRHVRPRGLLDPELASLPAPLDAIVGQGIDINAARLRAYLAAQGVAEAELGGALTDPVSHTEGGLPALYFVIHDTSAPNLLDGDFPAGMNSSDWEHNDLSVWAQGQARVAHVFISRVGASVTAVDFGRGWRATKLESLVIGAPARGRFLHVENVMPRRSLAGGPPGNDIIAPEPGLTDPQLRRLALVYIAASVRAGQWLIPCQHAVLDSGIENGHDDPQNFDLNRWAALISAEIAAIRATP